MVEGYLSQKMRPLSTHPLLSRLQSNGRKLEKIVCGIFDGNGVECNKQRNVTWWMKGLSGNRIRYCMEVSRWFATIVERGCGVVKRVRCLKECMNGGISVKIFVDTNLINQSAHFGWQDKDKALYGLREGYKKCGWAGGNSSK